jgi:dihydrofolate reductase
MRNVFVFMNVSVDGYVEGPGHDISWAHGGDSEPFARKQGPAVDLILFGRRTYEMMSAFWPTEQAAAVAPETARFMNEKPKYVASHAAFEPGWDKVTVLRGDVIGQVRRLKEEGVGKIAIFGSNTLCASLAEADLIDEFQMLVNPVLLGEGTSFVRGLRKRAELRLVSAEPQALGGVLLTYARATDTA